MNCSITVIIAIALTHRIRAPLPVYNTCCAGVCRVACKTSTFDRTILTNVGERHAETKYWPHGPGAAVALRSRPGRDWLRSRERLGRRADRAGCLWRAPSAQRGNHARVRCLVTRRPRPPVASALHRRNRIHSVWRGTGRGVTDARAALLGPGLNAVEAGLRRSHGSDRTADPVCMVDTQSVDAAIAHRHAKNR